MSAPASASSSATALGEHDLAELLSAFNDASQKLQSTHESLRAEVARLQAELTSANQQLERSRRLAALGEMAAGIAHEVRNPLGCIRLYAKMLTDDLTDRPGERAIAEKIASATRGLDAVVSDVLAFARELRLRPEPVRPWSLLEKAVEEALASDAGEGGSPARIRIVRESADVEGHTVTCDPALMHRAIVNVVRNAIQAMRDAANAEPSRPCVLHLAARRVRLPDPARPDQHDADHLAIVIRDTGPGIPPGVMDRMFNPFFTTRAAGTGLGLAIVHRILDAHGGRILVSNAAPADHPGEPVGAVVELLIPAQPTIAQSPGNPIESALGHTPQDQDGLRPVRSATHIHTHTRSAQPALVVQHAGGHAHGGRSE